jgi:hypothetical protein
MKHSWLFVKNQDTVLGSEQDDTVILVQGCVFLKLSMVVGLLSYQHPPSFSMVIWRYLSTWSTPYRGASGLASISRSVAPVYLGDHESMIPKRVPTKCRGPERHFNPLNGLFVGSYL